MKYIGSLKTNTIGWSCISRYRFYRICQGQSIYINFWRFRVKLTNPFSAIEATNEAIKAKCPHEGVPKGLRPF